MDASAPTFTFYICLQVLFYCCLATPRFQSSRDNTTVVEGETMTLTCNFSEPIVESQFAFWKKGKLLIGSCQGGRECYKVDEQLSRDSRVTLDSQERRWFELIISEVRISDAGSYECGSYVSDEYRTVNAIEVLVLPNQGDPQRSPESTTETSPLMSDSSAAITNSSPKGSALTNILSSQISPLTTYETQTRQTPQVTELDVFVPLSGNPLPEETDSKVAQYMLYYCGVISICIIALLLVPVAACRMGPSKARGSGTLYQMPVQTTEIQQMSSPSTRAHVFSNPSPSDLQQYQNYHVIDEQIQETSFVLQQTPSTSQGNFLPEQTIL